MSSRLWILTAVLFVGIYPLAGCKKNEDSSSASRSGGTRDSQSRDSSPGSGAGATVVTTADELTKEFAGVDTFTKDGKAKQEKYRGRTIEVTGEVDKNMAVGDGTEEWTVNLRGVDNPGKGYKYLVVDCQFNAGSPLFEKAKSVKAGDKCVIRGKFSSAFDYGIRLKDCDRLDQNGDKDGSQSSRSDSQSLGNRNGSNGSQSSSSQSQPPASSASPISSSVADSESKPIEIKATDLAQELIKLGPTEFRDKYKRTTFQVEGKVDKVVGKDERGVVLVSLKGGVKPGTVSVLIVVCQFFGKNASEAEKIKEGATVRIKAELEPTYDRETVFLTFCELSPP